MRPLLLLIPLPFISVTVFVLLGGDLLHLPNIPLSLVVAAFSPLFYICYLFFIVWATHRRVRLSDKFVLVFVVILLSTISVGAYFFDRDNTASILVLVVGLLATAGWMYTNYISIKNATTSHTMSILMQMRNSAELNRHRNNINALIPYKHSLDNNVLKEMLNGEIRSRDEPQIGLEESVLYVLNYYEFISAGVNLNQLNERLIRNTMRSIFVNFHDMVEVYIEHARRDDIGRENPKIFQHFRELVARFRETERPDQLVRGFTVNRLPQVRPPLRRAPPTKRRIRHWR